MSIGVSNFNRDLLDDLLTMANVKPHLIQNFADLGKLVNCHFTM